ncbi:MAG: prepilin-type N-terminal cleavage/methylation domain-containing protein, partial [Puniceicoccales bacterium]|nr:prepilin-type N-terminal cleavage/methylation domain-containing protein [Puniceicoccales bacterium]
MGADRRLCQRSELNRVLWPIWKLGLDPWQRLDRGSELSRALKPNQKSKLNQALALNQRLELNRALEPVWELGSNRDLGPKQNLKSVRGPELSRDLKLVQELDSSQGSKPSRDLKSNQGLKSPSVTRTGFTLIEVVVALCIVAILTAIAIPGFKKATEDFRLNATLEDTVDIMKACRAYYLIFNEWPGDGGKNTIPAGKILYFLSKHLHKGNQLIYTPLRK